MGASSGNGVTARELAYFLYSGANDDNLTSNGEVLDEIVENRIVNASANERNTYKRMLSLLVDRLEDVELHGYSPPKKVGREETAISKDYGQNDANSTATTKKSKKKKKKQTIPAPAPAPVTEAASASKSASLSSDDDLSDPVAVALLGMGFTADQIKSAAKSLGGFERATADDMVVWILSGGELNNDDRQTNPSEEPVDDKDECYVGNSPNAVMTKAQKKAAERAQQETEEVARKVQDEIASAQRAAAKREEQRRIRREWNEREQARQQEERNAKIAEALEKQRLVDLEKLKTEAQRKNVLPVLPLGHSSGGRRHPPGNGPPRTIVAGQGPVTAKLSSVSNMGIPQGPVVKSPTILTRPGNAPPVLLPGLNSKSVSNQPLFPPTLSSNASPTTPPTIQDVSNQHKKPTASTSAPLSSTEPRNPPPARHPAAFVTRGVKPNVVGSRFGHAVSPENRLVELSSFGNEADLRCMSSLMGNRDQLFRNHLSRSSSIPPPGFQPSVPATSNLAEPSTYIESNPMGQIRATAREFIPVSFKPPPTPAPLPYNMMDSTAVPSMSAQSTTVIAPSNRSSSNDFSANPGTSSLIEPMSSLLGSFGTDIFSQPVPSPTPGTKRDSPEPSVASSITGFSGLQEEKSTSRVGSIMTFESVPSGGVIQSTSILDSIS